MSNFKRVILITVDCLRADAVGYIGGGGLTPNIDKLAKNSLVFTRAFSNGPGTNQSFPSILTSTYFLMHGGMRLLPHYTTLAGALSQHGFRTVAFHSNPFLSRSLGWSRDFDEFYDFIDVVSSPSAFVTRQQNRGLTSKIERLATTATTALGLSGSSTFQRFLKKIYYEFHNFEVPYLEGKGLNEYVAGWLERNSQKKFFLWMHYMDPHYPYIPPDEYLSCLLNRKEAFKYNLSVNENHPAREEVPVLRKLYEGEVKYADACIGAFVSYLKRKGLWDDSLVFFTGDHGHAFLEHGRFGHAYDILYNEVIHVPLIVFGLDEAQKVNSDAQLLDIPPTALDLLGISRVPSFMGRSLLDAGNRSETIFSESAKPDLINVRYDLSKKVVSCIKDSMKLIINELQRTKELYDLKKDFQEKNNLCKSEEVLTKDLSSSIRSHLSHEDASKQKITSNKLENVIEQRLKSLGYF